MKELEKLIENTGLLPITATQGSRTIILDIRLLPAEYKTGSVKESVLKFAEDFNVKVIPVDSSRVDTRENSLSIIKVI